MDDRRKLRRTVRQALVGIDDRWIPEPFEEKATSARRHRFRGAQTRLESAQNRLERPRALYVLQIAVGPAELREMIRAVAIVANSRVGESGNRTAAA